MNSSNNSNSNNREAFEEEQRRRRRRAMIERARKEKERQAKVQKLIMIAAPVVCVLVVVLVVSLAGTAGKGAGKSPESIVGNGTEMPPGNDAGNLMLQGGSGFEDEVGQDAIGQDADGGSTAGQDSEEPPSMSTSLQDSIIVDAENKLKKPTLVAKETENTKGFPDTVISANGVLIDLETSEIIAGKGAFEKINPASMTKIMTVLVAAEQLESMEQLEDTFTITIDITDYSFVNDCSNVGFAVDEKVTVEDLFYGTILPSGADAALGLAIYTAGSEEAFVELMNDKLEELGLSETAHFTNCVGLYDENHYCTVYDMAVIMKAATDNPFCRKVLAAKTYNTSVTYPHPEGLLISNWFLRRIEDKDTHGEVLCAKTGYVVESGSCAASLAADKDGREYLCVTAGSTSSWRCIYDHVDLYVAFLDS